MRCRWRLFHTTPGFRPSQTRRILHRPQVPPLLTIYGFCTASRYGNDLSVPVQASVRHRRGEIKTGGKRCYAQRGFTERQQKTTRRAIRRDASPTRRKMQGDDAPPTTAFETSHLFVQRSGLFPLEGGVAHYVATLLGSYTPSKDGKPSDTSFYVRDTALVGPSIAPLFCTCQSKQELNRAPVLAYNYSCSSRSTEKKNGHTARPASGNQSGSGLNQPRRCWKDRWHATLGPIHGKLS